MYITNRLFIINFWITVPKVNKKIVVQNINRFWSLSTSDKDIPAEISQIKTIIECVLLIGSNSNELLECWAIKSQACNQTSTIHKPKYSYTQLHERGHLLANSNN